MTKNLQFTVSCCLQLFLHYFILLNTFFVPVCLSCFLFSHYSLSLSLLVSHFNEGESGLDDESQDITGGTCTHKGRKWNREKEVNELSSPNIY